MMREIQIFDRKRKQHLTSVKKNNAVSEFPVFMTPISGIYSKKHIIVRYENFLYVLDMKSQDIKDGIKIKFSNNSLPK